MKPVLKVCFIMPKAYPLFNPDCKGVFGGAEVDFYNLSTELAKDANFEVNFIVADYGQPDIEVRNNVTIIKSLDFKKNLISQTLSLWRAMRKANALIYLQKTASWGTLFVSLFCKLNKRYFIYRTATTGCCDGTWPKNYFKRKAFWMSLRNADVVLTQNVTDKENLLSILNVSADAIPNGQILLPYNQQYRDSILWVGRSHKVKRPELFIDLAESMPDKNFVMVCQRATGDNEYDTLSARAHKVKNLKFIDRVPFAKINNYFQHAMVFVNTSDTEGFPNTFIQACQFGTPILSLNVNPDDFLNQYKCGMYANGDWQRFKNMLCELLGPSAEVYGRNARQYVEENHDLKKIIAIYKEIFYNTVGINTDDGE